MRCPSCNKFASYDEPEVEGDPEVSGDSVTCDARIVLKAACCGDELKQAEFSLEATITEDEKAEPDEEGAKAEEEAKDEEDEDGEDEDGEDEESCEEGHDWELDGDPELEGTSRTQTHDRNGKPIKSARYAKTYYGVEMSGEVKCSRCGATGSFKASDETSASGMEELT